VNTPGPVSVQAGVGRVVYRMRSCKAAFTAELAWKAPSTSTEAIVARANPGVTS
jgi:hypothetical protein